MKPSFSLALLLSAVLVSPLWARDPGSLPVPPVPPVPPAPPEAASDDLHLDEVVQDIQRNALVMAKKAGAEARSLAKQTRRAFENWPRAFGGPHGPRTMVLPAGLGQPETLGPGHEDLSVMSAILVKAVNPERHRFDLAKFAGSSDLDALYLEGYGALFFLNADMPLAAPASAAGDVPVKPEDSTWERTKRELRGGDSGRTGGPDSWSDDEQPKYSADKVAALQHQIIDALKHAKNLRNLKSGETVTVVVNGQSLGKRTSVGRFGLQNGGGSGAADPSVSPNIVGYMVTDSIRQSTLVIRASRADILRYANGELSLEAFTKTVAASAY